MSTKTDKLRPWLSFTVPLIPPSVNHYKKPRFGGGFVVTRETKAFKDAVCIFARQADASVSGVSHGVQLRIYLPKGGRGDVDNFAKVALDALVAAGTLRSDDSVEELRIAKMRDRENPRTEFLVWDRDQVPECDFRFLSATLKRRADLLTERADEAQQIGRCVE